MIESLAPLADAHSDAPPSPALPTVMVNHLRRSFGHRDILKDVSFTVLQGGALGIAGANGCGKTVLLRLLAALDRPSSGTITVAGSDSVTGAREVRRTLGYVSEEPMLYDGLSTAQYLHFVGRARGLGKHLRAVSVDTLLQVVGLNERRSASVHSLSPGERRRLALAGALVHEPSVLLLDDPLRGLDGYARLEQMEVLRELRRLGTCMVLAVTRPEDALDVCEHLAVLRDGVLAWYGNSTDAAALSAPGRNQTLAVRVEVLAGLDTAVTLLRQHTGINQLELEEDGQTLWFQFALSREELALIVPELVRAGCTLAHFGIEQRSSAAAVAGLFHGDA